MQESMFEKTKDETYPHETTNEHFMNYIGRDFAGQRKKKRNKEKRPEKEGVIKKIQF